MSADFIRASDLDEPLQTGDRVRYHGQRYEAGIMATVVAGQDSKMTLESQVLVKFDTLPNQVGVPVGALELVDNSEGRE